MDLRKKYT